MWRRLGLPFGLAAAGVALLALAAPRLQRDTSLAQLFPTGSDVRQAFADFDAAFGTDDVLLVVVEDDREPAVFNPTHLEYLDRIARALRGLPGVEDVVSLVTIAEPTVLDPGLPPLALPLVRSDQRITPARLAELRAMPLVTGLVGEGGHASATWVLLDPALRARPDYLARVQRIAAQVPGPPAERGLRLQVTGFPLLQAAAVDLLWKEALWLLAAAVVVVAATAALGGAGWTAALAFVAAWPAIAGVLVALAFWTDTPVGLFGNAILPLLLITSGASLVHLGRARRRGHPPLRSVLFACGLSALTTAVGFGSLATSDLQPLASVGIAVAIGSVVAFVLGSVSVIAATVRAPASEPARSPQPPRPRRGLLPVAVVLAAPWFLLDPGRLAPLSDVLDVLPASHPAARTARQVATTIGAQTSFEVVVAVAPEQLLDPDFLLALPAFQQALVDAGGGEIPFVLSPVTLLRHLDRRMHDDRGPDAGIGRDTAEYAIRFLIRPFLTYFRDRETTGRGPIAKFAEAMRQLVSLHGDRLRFGCRIPALAPERVLALRERLRSAVLEPWAERLHSKRIYATGYAVLVAEAAAAVRTTQVRSIAASGAVLALLLWVVLRRARLWLIAVAVNAATVSTVLSVAWLLGAEIDLFSAVLVASLLGLLVDDTIHLAWHFRHGKGTSRERVAETLSSVGPAVRVSSLGLALGFATFFLSSLPAYRQFAWLAIVAVLATLFWDLVVLPRLLARG